MWNNVMTTFFPILWWVGCFIDCCSGGSMSLCVMLLRVNPWSVVVVCTFFLITLQPLWALTAFQSPDLFTTGRTPWTSDQLVARPLPKHRTAQTQNKHIYTPNIHALNGIRTYDHSIWASDDSSCLRPLGYRDRPSVHTTVKIITLGKLLLLFYVN
jgi:hypothetical protein